MSIALLSLKFFMILNFRCRYNSFFMVPLGPLHTLLEKGNKNGEKNTYHRFTNKSYDENLIIFNQRRNI